MSQQFLQGSYELFLFSFRSQPDNLHLPGHKSIWSTVLPSTTKDLWYPACLLELKPRFKPQMDLAIPPTLSYFRSLFKDYKPPLLQLIPESI